MAGGGKGGLARSWIARADGSEDIIPSKTVTRMQPGDRLVIETAGGGGYGAATRRHPAAAAADVADGKVSAEAARATYGRKV
jgi:N-methylhydantoinase B/oxoprolinase/acetone carboxylase alpha subunit